MMPPSPITAQERRPDMTPPAAPERYKNHRFPAEAERVLQPLQQLVLPLLTTIQLRSYYQVQHLLDGVTLAGHQYYGKSHFLAGLEDAAIGTLIAHFTEVSSPRSVIVLQQLGNAANRVPTQATACAHRDARYNLNLIGQWTDRREAERHIQWGRAVWQALGPYGTGGVYASNVGSEAEEGAAGLRG